MSSLMAMTIMSGMGTHIAWIFLLICPFFSGERRLLRRLICARISVGVLLWTRLLRHRPHSQTTGLMPGSKRHCSFKVLKYVSAEGLLNQYRHLAKSLQTRVLWGWAMRMQAGASVDWRALP